MAMRDRQMLDLDKVCLRCIFSWLPVQTLASAACVCRKWRDIAAEDAVWGLGLTQGVGESYGRNATEQLPAVAVGSLAPHPTPPQPHRGRRCSTPRKPMRTMVMLGLPQRWADGSSSASGGSVLRRAGEGAFLSTKGV